MASKNLYIRSQAFDIFQQISGGSDAFDWFDQVRASRRAPARAPARRTA